jgi:hypothetical protein
MVKKLQGSVLSYYISKKKEKILNKLLGELTTTDIEVIKTKEMRPYMKQLKEKYGQELLKEIDKDIESSREMGGTGVHLRYPTDTASKYVSLFGLEGYFESIPNDINVITMENGTNDATAMDLPVSIGRFTELTTLVIDNMIKSLPESIGNCNQLSFLNLSNNSQLDNLPESLSKLTCLEFFSIMGSDPNIRIPEKLEENMTMEGEFWYVHFPEDMKKHCTGIVGF